ncbi:MAG: hypothetical protein K2H37_13400 [Lachnospiraceae bacterium]|nr:hypothetical protein [Lachnospiraceae bacterium]
MNGYLFTPMAQSYAESSGYMKNADGTGRAHDFGAAGGDDRDRRFQMECRGGRRRADAAKKRKKKQKQQQKSYWEKRAERRKLYMDLATKAWYKRENERQYQEQIALGRKEVSSAVLRQQAMERATGTKTALGVNPDVLSEAATDLAQSYVFFKIPSARMNPKAKGGAAK